MQEQPAYQDVVSEVQAFLRARVRRPDQPASPQIACCSTRASASARRWQHNLELLRALADLSFDGLPLLAGMSRKSMLGAIGRTSGRTRRLAASLAAALLAVQRGGAKILRVHDVAETRDALAIWQAVDGGLQQP
jgi:dihydropteroate synthase